ncbi:MAG TPA: MBG domain-containing protein [Gemmatimonadaceae bacterium]|nr:MBG domain-containing protein [Gemmatimonadaceae bacterium]
MRHVFTTAAVALATTVVLVACSDSSTPTAPLRSGGPASALETMAQNGCYNEKVDPNVTPFSSVDARVKALINALFIGDNLQSSLSMWENLKKDKLDGQPIQSHIDNISKMTLTQLGIYGLHDPVGLPSPDNGLSATMGAVRLLDLIFTCANHVPTSLPDPPAGFDGAFALVEAVANDIQINTTFKDAAAYVKGGSLGSRSMLVIARQPATVIVNTPFPKLSRTIDVAFAGPKPNRFTMLVCPRGEYPDADGNNEAGGTHRAVIAHQKKPYQDGDAPGTNVEYLTPTGEGGLECPESADVGEAWRMEKGFFKQRGMQFASLLRKAWSFVGPRPLYAGHAAIGGGMDGGFTSPVVLVDPLLTTEVVFVDGSNNASPSPSPATYGQQVTLTARLRIKDSPENPAVYRGKWVSPDAVTGVVNQLAVPPHPASTNVALSTALDGGSAAAALTDNASFATWNFPCVNAGGHTLSVSFPRSHVTAVAPLYEASAGSATFTVNKRPITVTAADKRWTYGDDHPTLTGAITPTGSEGVQTQCGDVAQGVYATDKGSASDANTYAGAISADVSFTSGSASNYDVTKVPGTATIDPRPINLTVSAPERQYGDEDHLTAQYDPAEIRNHDDAIAGGMTYAIVSDVTPVSDHGDHAVSATSGGSRIANYAVTVVPATLTIDKRVLTGSIGSTSRAYGDDIDLNTPAIGTVGNTTLCCGAVESSPLTWTFQSAAASAPVGTYDITILLGGPRAGNYDASHIAAGKLTVTLRDLNVSVNDASRNQGASTPDFTGTVTNVFSGDDHDPGKLAVSYDVAGDVSAPGIYADAIDAEVAGSSASNYRLVVARRGTLTIVAPPPAGDVLYGVNSGDDGLSVIDAATGSATFVGRLNADITKFTTPIAMATDTRSGALYVWNNSDGNTNETQVRTGVLLSVNSCSAVATQINAAPTGIFAGALAISPVTGTMYLLSSNLYSVDKSTGQLTTIAPLNFGVRGAAFDAQGVLYAVDLAGTQLVTIDVATGAPTVVANLSESPGTMGGLAFTPEGQLIGSAFSGTRGDVLFDIDVSTGGLSNFRSTSHVPQGMGFAPACTQ